ncbi:DUF6706 family protein [Parabacteroides goldsteinii]|uniref:DUF6706 family protein n=1 Tax=Parabacteroides goldsteinii TaxID=328812 RepID=UPI0032BF601E
MTVSNYITQKIGSFGMNLSEADLLDMTLNSSVSLDDEITQENMIEVNKAMAVFIPSLLARPTSVNESGFSISWDKDGIKAYYSLLCKQLGIEDVLASRISDASMYW